MATWSTKKAFGAGIQRMGGLCSDGTLVYFIAHSGGASDVVYQYDYSTNTETQILDGSADITNYIYLYNLAVFKGELYALVRTYPGTGLNYAAELYQYDGTPNSWTKVDEVVKSDGRGTYPNERINRTTLFCTDTALIYLADFYFFQALPTSIFERYDFTRYSTDGSTFNTAGSSPYDGNPDDLGFTYSFTTYPYGAYSFGQKTSDDTYFIWTFNESSGAWTEVATGANAQYGYRLTTPDALVHFADLAVDYAYTDDEWGSMTAYSGFDYSPIQSYGTATQYALNNNDGNLYTFSGGTFTLLDTVSTFTANIENTAIIRLSDGTSLIFGRDLFGSGNGIILERSASLPAPPTPSLTHSAAGLPGAILI